MSETHWVKYGLEAQQLAWPVCQLEDGLCVHGILRGCAECEPFPRARVDMACPELTRLIVYFPEPLLECVCEANRVRISGTVSWDVSVRTFKSPT